jgi:hypothetical protein
MAFIPFVGAAISAASHLFGSLERGVNSSEHNFKADLSELLQDTGLPPEQLKIVMELLNSGKDEQIGDKLRALMSSEPPVISPELAPVIAELAQKNGVPRSSIDTEMLGEPIDAEEAQQKTGPMLDNALRALGRPTLGEQGQEMIDAFDDLLQALPTGIRG